MRLLIIQIRLYCSGCIFEPIANFNVCFERASFVILYPFTSPSRPSLSFSLFRTHHSLHCLAQSQLSYLSPDLRVSVVLNSRSEPEDFSHEDSRAAVPVETMLVAFGLDIAAICFEEQKSIDGLHDWDLGALDEIPDLTQVAS